MWVSDGSGIGYQWGNQDALNKAVGREVVPEVREGELKKGGGLNGVTRMACQMIQGGDLPGSREGPSQGSGEGLPQNPAWRHPRGQGRGSHGGEWRRANPEVNLVILARKGPGTVP